MGSSRSVEPGKTREKRTGMCFLDLRQAANPAGAGGGIRGLWRNDGPRIQAPATATLLLPGNLCAFSFGRDLGLPLRTGWVGEGDAKWCPRFDRETHRRSKPRTRMLARTRLQRGGLFCISVSAPDVEVRQRRKKTSVCRSREIKW